MSYSLHPHDHDTVDHNDECSVDATSQSPGKDVVALGDILPPPGVIVIMDEDGVTPLAGILTARHLDAL